MQGKDLTPFLTVIGAVILLVIAAGIVILVLRRKLFAGDDNAEVGAGGVLETMRDMWRRGEITEDEYRAAQAAIVAKTTGGAPKPVNPSRPQTRHAPPAELRAKPGFDLTGAPLPPSGGENPPRRDPPSSV